MDLTVLRKCSLFKGVPEERRNRELEEIPRRIQCYTRGETVFHMMHEADRIGILLEGSVEAQKPFPNGNQVNVSHRVPGDMIGPAAAFSASHRYPCDVVASEPTTILFFEKDNLMKLLQKDAVVLENFMTEMATAASLLQERLELFSYSGIADKAAFWLLRQYQKTGSTDIPVPGSVSEWALFIRTSTVRG